MDADDLCQTFELARRGVVLPDQGHGADHLGDGRLHLATQAVDARGSALRDHDVAVAVEHQSRQAVGFAVHEAIERLAVQALTQRQRHTQPVHQQRCIEWIGGIAADDARRDERARIDVGESQELVAVGMHLHRGTGFELREWCGGGVDFVAEDPQMAGTQTTIFAALEFEDGN